MFRDRPLTWLLFIATLLLDSVFALHGTEGTVSRILGTGLYLGQSLWLGCWLAVGARHRLERGAVFVIGQIAVALIICLGFAGESLQSWGRVIAALSLYGFTAFVGALMGRAASLWLNRRDAASVSDRVRFPIIELLGWTVVVAIASAVMRQADFRHLVGEWNILVLVVGTAVLGGIFVALFVTLDKVMNVRGVFAAAVLIVYFVVAYEATPDAELVTSLVLTVAYAILWGFVMRLDAPSHADTAQ